MIGALAWLLGSKAGRITALSILTFGVVVLVLWQAFRQGEAAEQAQQAQASLEALRRRISTDDQISKMSTADRRRELARWVRNDED